MISRQRRARLRRRVVALLVVGTVTGAVIFLQLAGGSAGPPPPGVSAEQSRRLDVRIGRDRVERIDLSAALHNGRLDARRVRRVLDVRLPVRWALRDGAARVVYRLDRRDAVRAVLDAGGPIVTIAARPFSSSIRAPVIAQALRNNCESAALAILLATVGKRVPQLRIQAALPTSGPLDPLGGGSGRIWGDPEIGYVGRPDGGGVAGGFGVYQRPVMATAGRLGVALEDLSRRPAREVVGRVRAGRAVMLWIGLSDGPYGEWISPAGRSVRANFGEHTVVLVGVTAEGRLRVVNPLEGTREVWTRAQLEQRWRLLDRRALAVPA